MSVLLLLPELLRSRLPLCEHKVIPFVFILINPPGVFKAILFRKG